MSSSKCEFEDVDMAPCDGDGVVDQLDIDAVLDAFRGADPCDGPEGGEEP